MLQPRATLGVIMINALGRVLMQQRGDRVWSHYPGVLSVPGGSVADCESLEEAARREFLEETGCRLGDLSFLSADDHRHPDGTATRGTSFRSLYDGRQVIRCYEGQAIRFVPPEEFPLTNIVPGLEKIIRRALRQRGAIRGGGSENGAQVQQ